MDSRPVERWLYNVGHRTWPRQRMRLRGTRLTGSLDVRELMQIILIYGVDSASEVGGNF